MRFFAQIITNSPVHINWRALNRRVVSLDGVEFVWHDLGKFYFTKELTTAQIDRIKHNRSVRLEAISIVARGMQQDEPSEKPVAAKTVEAAIPVEAEIAPPLAVVGVEALQPQGQTQSQTQDQVVEPIEPVQPPPPQPIQPPKPAVKRGRGGVPKFDPADIKPAVILDRKTSG